MGPHRTGWPWHPSRASSALVVLLLLVLGGVLLRVLVRNWSDNAYLGVSLAGTAVLVTSVPFVLAALIPESWVRRVVLAVGLVVLCVVGLLGSVMLIASLRVAPLGLVVWVAGVLGVLWLLLRPRH